jgi:hypothetical protein
MFFLTKFRSKHLGEWRNTRFIKICGERSPKTHTFFQVRRDCLLATNRRSCHYFFVRFFVWQESSWQHWSTFKRIFKWVCCCLLFQAPFTLSELHWNGSSSSRLLSGWVRSFNLRQLVSAVVVHAFRYE